MSDQLHVVLRLRMQSEENARKRLAEAEAQRNELAEQIESLEDYIKDYQYRLASPVQTSMQQKHILMSYIQQVQTAMTGHVAKLHQAERLVEYAKYAWLETKKQLRGIESVIESREELEKRKEMIREQKETDEFVNQRAGSVKRA